MDSVKVKNNGTLEPFIGKFKELNKELKINPQGSYLSKNNSTGSNQKVNSSESPKQKRGSMD